MFLAVVFKPFWASFLWPTAPVLLLLHFFFLLLLLMFERQLFIFVELRPRRKRWRIVGRRNEGSFFLFFPQASLWDFSKSCLLHVCVCPPTLQKWESKGKRRQKGTNRRIHHSFLSSVSIYLLFSHFPDGEKSRFPMIATTNSLMKSERERFPVVISVKSFGLFWHDWFVRWSLDAIVARFRFLASSEGTNDVKLFSSSILEREKEKEARKDKWPLFQYKQRAVGRSLFLRKFFFWQQKSFLSLSRFTLR